jgi:hypothetical protein
MRYEEDYSSLVGRICPVCGKEFFPTPEHVYKIYFFRKGYVLTCSYSCHRKIKAVSERLKEEAKQEDKRKKRSEKE